MKLKVQLKKYKLPIMVAGMMPTIIIFSHYFGFPKRAYIPLTIIVGFVFATITLWTYANQEVDGLEWWQDDNASGWRGY